MSNEKILEPDFLTTPKRYFEELIDQAGESRKIKIKPIIKNYLVDLLGHFLTTENLFMNEPQDQEARRPTLAELYLKACQAEKIEKIKSLKNIADRTLYISGFFGDSLKKKIIDVDYYVDIGGSAYKILSYEMNEDFSKKVYSEFSSKFTSYMDLLTYVSQKSRLNNDKDLLRLYDVYIHTGSELAKEQLIEKGLINSQIKKHLKQ